MCERGREREYWQRELQRELHAEHVGMQRAGREVELQRTWEDVRGEWGPGLLRDGGGDGRDVPDGSKRERNGFVWKRVQ